MAADSKSSVALRPTLLKLGTNPGVAGSAYVERGSTKIAVSVYAPREAPKLTQQEFSASGTLVCDVRFAPFASRQRRQRGAELADEERSASADVTQAVRPYIILSRYPKSVIEVFVMVLEADGGVDAAIIVAVALGLADAGIEMTGLPCAVAVAGFRGEGSASTAAPSSSSSSLGASAAAAVAGGVAAPSTALMVDPDEASEAAASFLTSVGFSSSGLLSHADHSGEIESAALFDAVALAMDGCGTLLREMRSALVEASRQRSSTANSPGELASVGAREQGQGLLSGAGSGVDAAAAAVR